MKHYPAEFKADAVALYRSRPGATIKSVAGDLGVNTETLRNWIRATDGRRPGAHSALSAAAQVGGDGVQAELAAARKRIRELEEGRDILRKAARYLAGDALVNRCQFVEDPPAPVRREAALRHPRDLPLEFLLLAPHRGRKGGQAGRRGRACGPDTQGPPGLRRHLSLYAVHGNLGPSGP
ncbi:transposase [Streptomyces sp. NPDC001820]|uniref:transposase n=1 Tax=Streptomyces sp. NPDC001820 TaxID=3364613 RepID=UPI0036A33AF4